jgi:hypothetical protein
MKKRILTLILIMTMFSIFGQKKKDNINKYLFKEKETTACFSCKHIVDGKKSILYVSHDNEGDWQFLCGEEGHKEADAKIISLKSATEIDQTINDLFEMPKGVGAERNTINEKWKPFKL